MKYELINKDTPLEYIDYIEQFLYNREIEYPRIYKELINNYYIQEGFFINPACLKNIDKACDMFCENINQKKKTAIIVDTDVDGYCSAAIMYMFIKSFDEDYPLQYILHTSPKAHGISNDIEIPSDIEFLIVPDAGTNDVERCKALKEKGVDILILDHHEAEKENPYAIVVNNQTSPLYSNKYLCGAGIVAKFIEFYNQTAAWHYFDIPVDLVALANISDNMDIKSYETRALITDGLAHITNNLFQALIKKQDFKINGNITANTIQWYVTPIINGMIRAGSQEEKELMFKAFVGEYEEFEYKTRATKNKPSETTIESIYDRVARLAANAKSRQDNERKKNVSAIADMVNINDIKDNKVLILDVTDVIGEALTGVVAIKIAEMYQRPCLLLRKITKDGKKFYVGSGRNYDSSPIQRFKDVCNSTELMTAQGHQSAFGICIPSKNMSKLNKAFNSLLQDIEYDSTYYVDSVFDLQWEEIDVEYIRQAEKFKKYVATGISEVRIAVKGLELAREEISVIGKNDDTIKFTYGDIDYIMFGCDEHNQLLNWVDSGFNSEEVCQIELVGKPCMSEYEGIIKPQIQILDVVVCTDKSTSVTDDEDDEWEW